MRLMVCFAVLFAALTAQVDILRLRDGSRYSGTLVERTENEIVFRTELADGASAVRLFPAGQVERVERSSSDQPGPAPTNASQSQPATAGPDFEQMLREAYELIDDEDLHAALRALRRVVTRAPDDVLEDLERHVRAERGSALDEFMATIRLRAALGAPSGRFDLKFATRYEAAALGRQLEPLQQRLLSTTYHGKTIAHWAGLRDEYTELQPDAPRMVGDARLAAAVIGARVRFDPRLKSDIAERRRLAVLRADLARLVAKISALPGYTSLGSDGTDRDDPTLVEARRLVAEQAAAQKAAAKQATGKQEATSQPAEE